MADMKELTGSTYFPAEGQSFRNYIEELLKAKPKFSGLFTQQSPVKPISAGATQAGTTVTAPQSSNAPFGYTPDGYKAEKPQLTEEQQAYFDWLEANPGYKDKRGAAMSGAIGALTNLIPGASLLNKAAGVNPFSGLSGLFDTERSLWNQFQIDQARQASGQVFDAAARSMRSGYVPEQPIVQGLLGGYAPSEESIRLAIQMANEVPQQPVYQEPVYVPPAPAYVAPEPVAPEPVAVSYPVPSSSPVYSEATGGYVPTYTGEGIAPSGSAYFGYSTPVYYGGEGE